MISSVSEEIELRLRILELERQTKDAKKSIYNTFKEINDKLDKTKQIDVSSINALICYDEDVLQIVKHLEAIYNILKIMDERLKNVEQN